MATLDSMQQIIDQSERDILVYQDILARLHALYANAPMANEKATRWIEEIGGHIEYVKANMAAARKFQEQDEP